MCYFWVENLSNLCKLIVCGSQILRSTQQTQRSPRLIVFCARCARLRFAQVRTFVCQCAIYAQDLRKILSLVRKIALFSPMCNICTRFVQDCTSLQSAQYMHKICARLHLFLKFAIQGVPKHLLESREQCIVVLLFNFVFSGCLTRCKINVARIVLFKSTIKLNNYSSDKKHNL